MWSPTHVQVTVQKARNLQSKGRKGTNDAFALIQLGKEKFQTSIQSKSVDPEWFEECDLTLLGRDSDVMLTVYHRNALGLDEFLGQTSISLQGIESFDRPFTKWYTLKGKSENSQEKNRGELEVRIAFIVQRSNNTQSLNDLSIAKKKKHSIKNLAASVGHKIQKLPSRSMSLRNFDPRKRLERLREKQEFGSQESGFTQDDEADVVNTTEEFNHAPMRRHGALYSSTLSLPQSAMITSSIKEADSMEEISCIDDAQISDSSSTDASVLNEIKPISKKISSTSMPEAKVTTHGEWTSRIFSHLKDSTMARSETNLPDVVDTPTVPMRKTRLETFRHNLRRHTLQLAEPPDLTSLKLSGGMLKNQMDAFKSDKFESSLPKDIPREVVQQYERMNHKDLVLLAIKQQEDIERQRDRILDLENYLDNLLVRVMETTPRILQKPYIRPACHR